MKAYMKILIIAIAFVFAGTAWADGGRDGHHKSHGKARGHYKVDKRHHAPNPKYVVVHHDRVVPRYPVHEHRYVEEVHVIHHEHYPVRPRYVYSPSPSGFFLGFGLAEPGLSFVFGASGR